jgi:hypothetical protein
MGPKHTRTLWGSLDHRAQVHTRGAHRRDVYLRGCGISVATLPAGDRLRCHLGHLCLRHRSHRGTPFANKPWIGLIVALGLALIVSLFAEVVRRILRWRRGGRTKAASAGRGSRDGWTAFAGDQTGSHDANAADGDVTNVRLRPEGQRAAAARSPAGTAGQTHPQGAV